jgi:hypothetical protein
MTLSELREKLRSRIGNPDLLNSDLDAHLNSALLEIWNKYKFQSRKARAHFQTASGKDKYSVSSITDVIYTVWDRTNKMRLERIAKTGLAERDYAGVQSGKPQFWAHIEGYLQLLPVPDGIYTIEFVYKPRCPVLVKDLDVPAIPPTWHRGIYILASAIYYEDQAGDPMRAAYHRRSFQEWVADQPVEEHEETEAIDSGVEIPTLSTQSTRRPDGVWWDALP